MRNLIAATEQLLDQLGFPRSIADLGISKEEFERAMPDLAKLAFDDPSWRSNPRMPLMSELVELFWKAYQGRGVWRWLSRESQLQNAVVDGGVYGNDRRVAQVSMNSALCKPCKRPWKNWTARERSGFGFFFCAPHRFEGTQRDGRLCENRPRAKE